MEVWEGIRSSEISSVIEAAKIKVPNSVIVKPYEDEDVVGMDNQRHISSKQHIDTIAIDINTLIKRKRKILQLHKISRRRRSPKNREKS